MSSLIGVRNIIIKFITFFCSLGIAHRVSCPHTHQQNGSAECKHCHIVESGLALLTYADVPIKYWDHVFLTTTYLINRLPTHVIDNKCSLERLFHTPPNYSLKFFGCACWHSLSRYNKQKFSFQSKECVFLGYRSLHKGYKCLDTNSDRVYISRDVIFDENVFPFKRAHLNSSPTLQPTHNAPDLRTLHLCNNNTNLEHDHMHIFVPTNSLEAENLVPTLALRLRSQSSASLLRESTLVVPPMIVALNPLPADPIPASLRPHSNSLGSDPRDRSPGLPQGAQRSIESSIVGSSTDCSPRNGWYGCPLSCRSCWNKLK